MRTDLFPFDPRAKPHGVVVGGANPGLVAGRGADMAGTSKQLICPECGQVMATAAWRLFGGLRITTPDGFPLSPVSDDLLLRTAEQRLASASAEDYPEAKRRRDAIVRNAGDRFYDTKCPQGHYTLKTAPEIARVIRKASGDRPA